MTKKITIGSRGSKLALIYAHNAKKKILVEKKLNFEAKIKIWGFWRMAISNFWVPNRNSKGIEENDVQILEIKF